MGKYEDDEEIQVPKKKVVIDDEDDDVPTPKKKAAAEDEDEAPKAKRKPAEDEDEAPKPKRRHIDEDEDEPKPRRRPSDDEDEPKKKKGGKDDDKGSDEMVGIDLDFGDERFRKAPGTLERLEVEKDRVVRFAFLPGFGLKAQFTHYIEKQGTFICNSTKEKEGACCRLLEEEPQLRVCGLVVQYTNASSKDGKMPKSGEIEWEIKYLRMSRTNYNEIGKKKLEDEAITDFDLIMTTKAGKSKGYVFEKISNSTWWNSDPEVEAEILKAAERFKDGKALDRTLGRKISDAEYKVNIKKLQKEAADDDDDDDI